MRRWVAVALWLLAAAAAVHGAGEEEEEEEGEAEQLSLSGCGLRRLDDACLPPRGLRALDLSRNALADVAVAASSRSSAALAGLRSLDLSANAVRRVSSRWLRDAPQLRTLDLSRNALALVDGDAFAALTQLRWLNASVNRLVGAAPLAAFPAALRLLDLSHNALSALDAASTPRELRVLRLAGNRLPELRRAWLQGLPALEELDLAGNDVRVLETGVLDPVSALRELNLRANRLESLDAGCFAVLKNLQTLDLSENALSSLENGTLAPLSALRTLSLRENRLEGICEMCLWGLDALEDLDLSSNRISSLENGTFSCLGALLRLNLSGNRLEVLADGWSAGLAALQALDLSRNALFVLENGTFSALGALLSLNVSRNRVSSLGEECFWGLTRLQRLDASENALRAVWPGVLAPLSGLTDLLVAGNPLHPTQHLLPGSRRLQRVDASRARLRQVPAALTRSVRALALAGNAVAAVRRGDLDSYPLLAALSLSDNRVADVEDDALGRLDNLQQLRLDGNRLAAVPRSLPASLELLHLQRNRVVALHAPDLLGLPKLRELSLRECGLASIEAGAFAQLNALEVLDLSANPLLALSPDALAGPGRLRVLRLSRLDRLKPRDEDQSDPATSAGVGLFPVGAPEHLEVLELDRSPLLARQLIADTAALAAFRELRELNLERANVSALRSDLFGYLPRLSALHLADNPLSCARSGYVLWLAEWMRKQDEEAQKMLRSATCKTPSAFRSRAIIELSAADYREKEGSISQDDTVETRCPALITLCREMHVENTSANTTSPTPVVSRPSTSTLFPSPISTIASSVTFTSKRTATRLPSTFTTPTLNHPLLSNKNDPKEDKNETLKKRIHGNSSKPLSPFLATKQKDKVLINITVLHILSSPKPAASPAPKLSSSRNIPTSHPVTMASAQRSASSSTPSPTVSEITKTYTTNRPTTLHIIPPTASTKPATSKTVKSTSSVTVKTTRRPPSRAFSSVTSNPISVSSTVSSPSGKNSSKSENKASGKPFDSIMRDKSRPKSENSDDNLTHVEAKRDGAQYPADQFVSDDAATAKHEPAGRRQQTVGSFIDETRRKMKEEHDARRQPAAEGSTADVRTATYESGAGVPPPDGGSTKALSLQQKHRADGEHAIERPSTTNRDDSWSPTLAKAPPNATTPAAAGAAAWHSAESLLLDNASSRERAPAAAHAAGVAGAASGAVSGAGNAGVFHGSHPGMFVLLGVGVAVAAALATALSHCAKRRRRQAVEYSRQQDIEVRSMSSIGDLW